MRAHKRPGEWHEEIGGGFTSLSSEEPALEHEGGDQDPILDLYEKPSSIVAPRPHHTLKRRLQAKAIAEAKLNRLAEELLELADELRWLHPQMADALDDAWNGTDTALEILLNDDAW